MALHDNNLGAILAESAALLTEGKADPASVWRNPTLVTLGLDGMPQARTVVLRRFDLASRQIETHTDVRSAKWAELQANPVASLHGWDADRRVQLRLRGTVRLLGIDAAADAAWKELRPQTRATYAVTPGPGTTLSTPDDTGQADEAASRRVFCVVRLTWVELEYLYLGQDSHRRARFGWAAGQQTAKWLVP